MQWECFSFSQDELKRNQAKKIFEMVLKKKKDCIFWAGGRCLPLMRYSANGRWLVDQPFIRLLLKSPVGWRWAWPLTASSMWCGVFFEKANSETYVCSLSCRTIVYKGMFLVGQLRTFYADLQNPGFQSAIALVHSVFPPTPSVLGAGPSQPLAGA